MSYTFSKTIAICALVLFVSGCASNASFNGAADDYVYAGEKYGKVVVRASASVQKDAGKGARVEQLGLEQKIIAQLASRNLFDENASGTVDVTIGRIRVRNAFNAIMFGFLSGTDNIAGTVRLQAPELEEVAFEITAAYGLGGLGGGQDTARLGWMSEKFAELTVQTILGETTE